jgi:hypothetical protein
MGSMLKKASNRVAFAKVGIYGEAGSGKTRTAVEIAIGLVKANKLTKPVGFFDTEPAASYMIPFFEEAGIEFLVYDESRALKDLMSFVREAEEACSVVIADSITHVWRDAQASYLKVINEAAKKRLRDKYRPMYKLEFHHWQPIKAAWAEFTDLFLSSKVHFIVCGRAGSIYEYQQNEETGKKELITVGTKMATEKELGYEPSLLIEMVKHRENGKIINRALIEKDRADKLNGNEIDFPNFESFKPHFDFLNIGGTHFDSMSQRDSGEMFTVGAEDDGFGFEKKAREILCEEIKSLLVTWGIDGASSEAKQTRNKMLIDAFGTGSWTAVEYMSSEKIRAGYHKMKAALENIPDPIKPLEDVPDFQP